MERSVVSPCRALISQSMGVQCLVVIIAAAVGCSEDLPVQGGAPGTQESGQTAAGGGAAVVASGAGGQSSTSSGTAGNAGATPPGNGTGSSAGAPSGTSGSAMTGGVGASSSMSSGGSGTAAMSSNAGAMSMTPMVKVVPACMGRGGEMVCDGAKMIKCSDMFEAAETMPCMNEAQCRAGLAGGKCGECDPGFVMCTGADLFECSMSGAMEKKEACDSEALCDAVGKKCDPAVCQLDEYDCKGGEILRCKDDLTAWESQDTCPMELCDKAGKKCNVCMPSAKVCAEDGATLKTCSADGTMEVEMKCPTATPKCIDGECKQCATVDDCPMPNQCQTTACNDNMCAPLTPKALDSTCSENGGKVCSLVGDCVACNTDFNCADDERCSPLLGCIERSALSVLQLTAGHYLVSVNAGWGLRVTGPDGVTADGRSVVGGVNPVAANHDSPLTVRVDGPEGSDAASGLGGLFFPCPFFVELSGMSATLRFADIDNTTDRTGTCDIVAQLSAM